MVNIDVSKNPVQVMRDLGIEKYPDVSKEDLKKLEIYCDELIEDIPDTLPNPYLDQYYLGKLGASAVATPAKPEIQQPQT